VWYYSSAGGTEAIFSLPQKTPNSYMSIGFCTWYTIANTMSGFGINTPCIKAIKSMYNARRCPNASRMRGMNECLEAKRLADMKRPKSQNVVQKPLRNVLLENPAKSQRSVPDHPPLKVTQVGRKHEKGPKLKFHRREFLGQKWALRRSSQVTKIPMKRKSWPLVEALQFQ